MNLFIEISLIHTFISAVFGLQLGEIDKMPIFIVCHDDFTEKTQAFTVSGTLKQEFTKSEKRGNSYQIQYPLTDDEAKKATVLALSTCYRKILENASSLNCTDITIPLIGENSVSLSDNQVLDTALSEISRFLLNSDMTVFLMVKKISSLSLAQEIEKKISTTVINEPVPEKKRPYLWPLLGVFGFPAGISSTLISRKLNKVILDGSDTFQEKLFQLIKEKEIDEVTVYRRANIDRKLFSKIRRDKNYAPSKSTALALAIALQLDMDETRDLLLRAGLALSPSILSDRIVSFFIENEIYDICQINVILFRETRQYLGERPAKKP